jgi:hypothetical protein
LTDGTVRSHTVTDDLDVVSKLPSLAVNLDAIVEEFFKVRTVENTVGGWFSVVDDEFVLNSGGFGSGGFGLEKRTTRSEPTEKGTQQSDRGPLTIVKVLKEGS